MLSTHARNLQSVPLLMLPLLIVSCAALKPAEPQRPEPPPRTATQPATKGWWYARFAINWPENAEPAWYMDLYLAREVVSPVLQRHRAEISLWRFHRRAARDGAGHQFSFIFYSSPQTARQIYAALQGDKNLGRLKKNGQILNVGEDQTAKISRPNIEDTSDRHWAETIQKTWPYYIMGVSRMWLELIDQVANQLSKGGRSARHPGDPAFYKQVNTEVEKLWEEEGGHAFLHHLNAIFGYEPVIVYEKRLQTF